MHIPGALALLVAVVASVCEGFPEGAPIEACLYGNKPNHYGTKAKPPQDSKVKFFATDSYYEPGAVIYGECEVSFSPSPSLSYYKFGTLISVGVKCVSLSPSPSLPYYKPGTLICGGCEVHVSFFLPLPLSLITSLVLLSVGGVK
ncbi:hypothetical protein E2C01_075827 [Portunus trituberculatus]|uniref:Uncharacterized protein n=1 Tax=Portunus trituberculatus TaxID=210409 RepID=A0A5B7I9P9_PORTR|nr:hypothetical protein [Portunus trituberculatus]